VAIGDVREAHEAVMNIRRNSLKDFVVTVIARRRRRKDGLQVVIFARLDVGGGPNPRMCGMVDVMLKNSMN
jgi:hypothetical protein